MAQHGGGGGPAQQFCSKCGQRLEPGARFCQACGTAAGAQGSAATGEAARPVRTGHIKHRNMAVQVILAIVTLGIYTIYWYYVTLGELHQANGKNEGAGIWTFLLFIPIAQFFAYWHHSFEYDRFVDGKYPGIAIFILWLVFSPVVWLLVQMDLNRAAARSG